MGKNDGIHGTPYIPAPWILWDGDPPKHCVPCCCPPSLQVPYSMPSPTWYLEMLFVNDHGLWYLSYFTKWYSYIYIIYTQYINFKIHCWWIYSRLEWWCRRLDSGRLAGRVLYIVSYSGFSQPKRKTRVQYNTIMPYHFYAHVHCPQIIGLTQHLPSPQPEQKHHWTTAFHGVTRDWAGASARDNSSQLITRWCLQDINWLINLANTYSIYIYMSCVYTYIYIYIFHVYI